MGAALVGDVLIIADIVHGECSGRDSLRFASLDMGVADLRCNHTGDILLNLDVHNIARNTAEIIQILRPR